MNEANLWKAVLCQPDRVGRGVDADTMVTIGQARQICAGAAAHVDDGRILIGRKNGLDQRSQNLPPSDKPPMAVFDLGVQLELFRLHGIK